MFMMCTMTKPTAAFFLLFLLVAIPAASAQNTPLPVPGTPEAAGRDHVVTTCPQVPTLRCKNGSTCEEGVADFGRHHENLDLQTHESGYFCKCNPGFIGHECGIPVDDCSPSSGYDPSDPTGVLRSCYHGSECRTGGDGAGFYCDCEKLNSLYAPTGTKFAGLMCQHESTALCAASLVGEGSAPGGQFCTNHGKCVKMVTGEEPHPGCVCREGWMGERCEVRDDVLLANAHNNNGTSTGGNTKVKAVAGIVLFSLLIGSIGIVTIWIAVIFIKARRAAAAGREREGKVVGVGDLDADGSGTLGNPSQGASRESGAADDGNFEVGDLEMTVTDGNSPEGFKTPEFA